MTLSTRATFLPAASVGNSFSNKAFVINRNNSNHNIGKPKMKMEPALPSSPLEEIINTNHSKETEIQCAEQQQQQQHHVERGGETIGEAAPSEAPAMTRRAPPLPPLRPYQVRPKYMNSGHRSFATTKDNQIKNKHFLESGEFYDKYLDRKFKIRQTPLPDKPVGVYPWKYRPNVSSHRRLEMLNYNVNTYPSDQKREETYMNPKLFEKRFHDNDTLSGMTPDAEKRLKGRKTLKSTYDTVMKQEGLAPSHYPKEVPLRDNIRFFHDVKVTARDFTERNACHRKGANFSSENTALRNLEGGKNSFQTQEKVQNENARTMNSAHTGNNVNTSIFDFADFLQFPKTNERVVRPSEKITQRESFPEFQKHGVNFAEHVNFTGEHDKDLQRQQKNNRIRYERQADEESGDNGAGSIIPGTNEIALASSNKKGSRSR